MNIVARHTIPVLTDDGGEWGAISDNMTGDGILGTLVERRADIGIAALYSWYKIDINILPSFNVCFSMFNFHSHSILYL